MQVFPEHIREAPDHCTPSDKQREIICKIAFNDDGTPTKESFQCDDEEIIKELFSYRPNTLQYRWKGEEKWTYLTPQLADEHFKHSLRYCSIWYRVVE